MESFQSLSITTFDEAFVDSSFKERYWKKVFDVANEYNASDIHIEPKKSELIVRFRVLGTMVLAQSIEVISGSRELIKSYFDALKHLCRMDLSINGISQDSSMESDSQNIRYRVALSPVLDGEMIVIRRITEDTKLTLENIGLDSNITSFIKQGLLKKSGMIVLCGATGSGKSTTMAAMINQLPLSDIKVISIENPVERRLDGVMQKEVTKDYDWISAIRMTLREDPDVIVIGEIRDSESASLAIEAAMTGHLVITTIHANSASEIPERLNHFKIEKHNIQNVLHLCMAQTLVQQLCSKCKVPLGDLYEKGSGCDCCVSGVVSRVPVVEIFNNEYLTPTIVERVSELCDLGLIDKKELSK